MLFRLPHRNENSSIGHVKSYISSHKESFVRIFNVMRLSNLLQKRKLNMAMIEPYIKRERERERGTRFINLCSLKFDIATFLFSINWFLLLSLQLIWRYIKICLYLVGILGQIKH